MKDNVGRVVVQAVETDVKSLGDVEGQAGADGMALVVKGIEGTAQAVVGEFVGGNVPDEFGARLLGPIGDVDQGHGVGQSCGDQQTEEGAVGILGLGIGRQVLIDDGSQVHAFQDGGDDGQGAEAIARLAGSGAEPMKRHGAGSFARDRKLGEEWSGEVEFQGAVSIVSVESRAWTKNRKAKDGP